MALSDSAADVVVVAAAAPGVDAVDLPPLPPPLATAPPLPRTLLTEREMRKLSFPYRKCRIPYLPPWLHRPHVPRPAVRHRARLHLRRLGRVVAAPRDGLGVDPPVGVDPVAGDPAVLHALAAGVGAGGPLPGLPLERTGEAVAQAGRLGLAQHPALSLVGALPSPPAPPAPAPEEGGPLGRGGGQAESVVDHPPAVADVHALNNSGGGAATARLGALEKIIVWRSPPFSNSVLPPPYL